MSDELSLSTKMASSASLLSRISRNMFNTPLKMSVTASENNAAYSASGGILPKPDTMKFKLFKIMGVVVPFVYGGATMSKNGATFLEENDIFVPDDDDD